MSKLKKGYTTGVHASFVFKEALEACLYSKSKTVSKTNKIDNDDLDVTKGCEIVATVSYDKKDLIPNEIKHNPFVFTCKGNCIKIYAGVGVGVVTKKGLKVKSDFPAINPVPLNAMRKIFERLIQDKKNQKLFCTISITDGKELAKKSANEKVGVLGGLSILGTTGFVKPVSSLAYLDSIETEINFAKENQLEPIVFTIGNSSYELAKKEFNKSSIIEIGNFVYDSLKIANSLHVRSILLICGIGKMTKIAQNHKNTHNRFGQIDFVLLKDEIEKKLNKKVDINSIKTVKGICEELKDKKEDFYKMIEKKAQHQMKSWFENIDIRVKAW